jgi:hypothetical protein
MAGVATGSAAASTTGTQAQLAEDCGIPADKYVFSVRSSAMKVEIALARAN